MGITEINDFGQFFEMKDKWNYVLERSNDRNIFLTWEYLSTFWKHFGKDEKLRILYIEDRNEIIAIAPFRQSRYAFSSPLGYDVIEPLGYRGLMPEGGDYTGLMLGEKEAQCLQLFLNYLVEHGDWDFIYMYDVPETSSIPYLLQKTPKIIPKFELEKGAICPYITIPNSMDTLYKGFSKKFRNNLRRCMRNLEKDYQRVQLKRYNEFGSVEEAMKMLFKLNQKRWKSRHIPGTFKTQEIRDFYISVAKTFADNGWLALHFLTVNEEPIAGLYCFEYDQKVLAAIIGFDPVYSRYSVGNLLFAKVIEKCVERKIKEFDFMKGDEPYKFGWTTKHRRNMRIKFVNERLTSNLCYWGIKTLKELKIEKILAKMRVF